MSLPWIIICVTLLAVSACIYSSRLHIQPMKSHGDPNKLKKRPHESMPPLIRKYLDKCGISRDRVPDRVYLRQRGTFYMSPEDKGHAMNAVQYFYPLSHDFVWLGKIFIAGIIPVLARDSFLKKKGRLTVRIMGCIKAADYKGPEMDQGELIRYLSEMIWFPHGFLDPDIVCDEIDHSTIRVSLKQEYDISVDLHFNELGLIDTISALRFKEKDLSPWEAVIREYSEFNGIKIPSRCDVKWKLSPGDFTYYEMEITDIKYQ